MAVLKRGVVLKRNKSFFIDRRRETVFRAWEKENRHSKGRLKSILRKIGLDVELADVEFLDSKKNVRLYYNISENHFNVTVVKNEVHVYYNNYEIVYKIKGAKIFPYIVKGDLGGKSFEAHYTNKKITQYFAFKGNIVSVTLTGKRLLKDLHYMCFNTSLLSLGRVYAQSLSYCFDEKNIENTQIGILHQMYNKEKVSKIEIEIKLYEEDHNYLANLSF